MFIPLYSPAPRRSTRPRSPSASQEDAFECGRSATNSLPLACNDDVGVTPANTQHVWMQSPQFSSVSQFLRYPSPPCKSTTLHPKSCGRVLTSSEHLAAMEAKEREKQERERAKLERKRMREEKKTRAIQNKYMKLYIASVQFIPDHTRRSGSLHERIDSLHERVDSLHERVDSQSLHERVDRA